MTFFDEIKNSSKNYTKISPQTGTCVGDGYSSIINGVYKRFKDTFFFSYIIQFFLVLLMYNNAGSGRYWMVLFYASLAGLIASLIENLTLSYECTESNLTEKHKVYTYLIAEVFWIMTEYSIPILNLIKMKAIAKSSISKVISSIIYLLLIPFVISRFLIGWERMNKGYLDDNLIQIYHGCAFLIMGIADLICTIFIIVFIKKYNNRSSTHGNDLTNHIQQSSYTILIAVDIVSLLLSILYIAVTFFNMDIDHDKVEEKKSFFKEIFSRDSVLPFHCVKSVFLLILATDAILFKYSANNNTSLRDSSGNVTSNMNESSLRTMNKSRISTYVTNDNNANHLTTPALRSPKVVSMSAFGYNPNNDIYTQSSTSRESMDDLNNSRMRLNNNDNLNNEIDIRAYPSEQFGFLHHGEYNELIFKNNQMKY